jgi:hypothetical protein
LDQVIALPPGAGRDAAIAGAYAGLHADTQRIIAAQPYARPAFTALHGEPLPASALPFTDELDGRARAHWFYRVASRSAAGVESELSPPTPPICCPDVVPPAPPTALLALADPAGGKVRLRWLASAEADVVRYDLYRAETRVGATDVRTMEKIDSMPAAAGMLERAVPAPPGQSYFRIVAEDRAGNRSTPSDLLGARPLRAPLDPPVWNAPVRGTTTVALSWTHPSDQRLSCLVERRPPGGSWRPLTTWLPRGTYRFEDVPPDLAAAWEYRLRARNTAEQVAGTLATVLLPAAA